ncbi:MAG: hypothetical protein HN509_09890 [Halobacteriovoraceae bacterium]|jgi:DNA-binding NtrC family response regulator|nr:hypothetical protein [Halobacteriovoraceae bacterium]MBT5092965.1 hypothetical protein [Halobacteriovoraceae bacterium]
MSNLKNNRIFLIEQEPLIRLLLEKVYSERQEELFTIACPVEAMPFLVDLKPQLLLFDWETLGGEQWLQVLRAVSSQIPVGIFLSEAWAATGPKSLEQKLLGEFPDRHFTFFQKPLEPTSLLDELQNLWPSKC